MTETQSIFARYYSDEPFVDRFASNPDGAVDVIIPVLHSNELWRKNLISIYREVPVRRLLLGDAGCTDDTLVTASQFPRVEIHDHTAYKSLGYSVRLLITAVESEWFLYFHSDVYLPDGWFDIMRAHQSEYDWFGCPMRITALVEYPLVDRVRPYAGTQMGRKAAFTNGLDRIDDDYVYRQEDWVFARIVEDGGFRHGRVEDTFHWHQVMPRIYGNERRVRRFPRVRIDVEMTKEEELYTCETQLRGTIKYLPPDSRQVSGARENFWLLQRAGAIDLNEFYPWVARTSPEWLPHLDVLTVPVIPAQSSGATNGSSGTSGGFVSATGSGTVAEEMRPASKQLQSLVVSPLVVLSGLVMLIVRRLTRRVVRILYRLGRPFVGPAVVNGRLSLLYRTYYATRSIEQRVRIATINQSRTIARAFEYLAYQLEK